MPVITTLDSQTETLSYLKIEKAINYWSQYKPGAGRVAEQHLQGSDCSRGHSGFRAHAPVSPGGHASIRSAAQTQAQNRVMPESSRVGRQQKQKAASESPKELNGVSATLSNPAWLRFGQLELKCLPV